MMLFLQSFKCRGLYSSETVADVDDTLGEMFLEEIPPTEEQLIVGIKKYYVWCMDGWIKLFILTDFLSLIIS